MKKTMAALFVLLVGLPFPVLAQESSRDVTDYRFEDELVAGDLFKPDGEVLRVRPRPSSQSLVRAREHFYPEMLKSIEKL